MDHTPAPTGRPAISKVCVSCGRDCSAMPRVKDAAGRYTCDPCFRAAQARRVAPAAAPTRVVAPGSRSAPSAVPPEAAGDDLLAKLVDESLAEASKGCPNCRSPMKSKQTLCVACGFNRELGKTLQTVEKAAVEVKQPKQRTGALVDATNRTLEFLFNPYLIGGIALAILMIGFAVYRADPRNNFYYYIGAVAIVYVLTLIILVADAASEGGAAIAAAIFPPYAFYYVFVVSDNGLLKFLYLITSIAAGLLRFALRYG